MPFLANHQEDGVDQPRHHQRQDCGVGGSGGMEWCVVVE